MEGWAANKEAKELVPRRLVPGWQQQHTLAGRWGSRLAQQRGAGGASLMGKLEWTPPTFLYFMYAFVNDQLFFIDRQLRLI